MLTAHLCFKSENFKNIFPSLTLAIRYQDYDHLFKNSDIIWMPFMI